MPVRLRIHSSLTPMRSAIGALRRDVVDGRPMPSAAIAAVRVTWHEIGAVAGAGMGDRVGGVREGVRTGVAVGGARLRCPLRHRVTTETRRSAGAVRAGPIDGQAVQAVRTVPGGPGGPAAQAIGDRRSGRACRRACTASSRLRTSSLQSSARVLLDRVRRQMELGGDLAVGGALRETSRSTLSLAFGQRCRRRLDEYSPGILSDRSPRWPRPG